MEFTEDTGWVDVGVDISPAVAGGELWFRRIGNQVFIRGEAQVMSGWFNLVDQRPLPEIFIPRTTVPIQASVRWGTDPFLAPISIGAVIYLNIDSNHRDRVHVRTTSSPAQNEGVVWVIFFYGTYVID